MKFLRNLTSKIMIIVIVAAILGFIGLFIYQSLRIREMQNNYASAQADLQRLQDRNSRLQQHLDFYNGPGYMQYVEKVARETLGMAKPGETVVLPVTDNNGTVNSNNSSVAAQTGQPSNLSIPAPPKSNWQNWLSFFFGS